MPVRGGLRVTAVTRYPDDVLTPGWQQAQRRVSVETPVEVGLVVEDPTSGFVGAVVRWENGLVVLEDRKGARRSFPFGPGFWVDGEPVALTPPKRTRPPAESSLTLKGAGQAEPCCAWLPSPSGGEDCPAPGGRG